MRDISVIIPTYNRKESLLRTLASLAAQDFESFEIVVADNAGQEEVRVAVEAFGNECRVPVRYFAYMTGGNSRGRNLGVKRAEGRLLVFTDDDLTFGPDWLSAYHEKFEKHPEMAAAGGKVTPVWEVPLPQWIRTYMAGRKDFGIYAMMDLSPEFTLSKDGFFYSCNMAIRPSVFEYSSFHPDLYGHKTVGDGEAGLNLDMYDRGELIGYVPRAEASHHITRERMTLGYFMKWAGHLAGNQMYRRWRGRRREPIAFIMELGRICRIFMKYWVKYPWLRGETSPHAIDMQFNAARGWSKLEYLFRMTHEKDLQAALDITDFKLSVLYPDDDIQAEAKA